MRVLVLGLVLACQSAMASWQLDLQQSSLNFISTKNAHISEIHAFDRFDGQLNDDASISISIDLTSVNTNIGIRDTRMQEMLFKVSEFANANFSAQLPESIFDMAVGEMMHVHQTGSLSLHGVSADIMVHVNVARLDDDRFIAYTSKPSIVNTSQFGLNGGVEALKTVAGLNSIGQSIPVTFSVTFIQ